MSRIGYEQRGVHPNPSARQLLPDSEADCCSAGVLRKRSGALTRGRRLLLVVHLGSEISDELG